MNLAFTHPGLLLLLPLAALPLIFGVQKSEGFPSLQAVHADGFSTALAILLRLTGALAIAALIVGLAGLHHLGQSIERLGEGAQIVLLFDRSSSMDNTFAGSVPTGEEFSKSTAAKIFLKDFVKKREHDRIGIAAFSTSPMYVLPLSDHKDATLAAIDAIDLPGLAYTNVAKGLAMALSMQEADIEANAGNLGGSRAIVLVSDGAAVISRQVQDQLRAAVTKRPVNLYWIFLRTVGHRGIFDEPGPNDQDTAYAMPERHLNLFFESLGIPYQAFEAENPAAVEEATAAIDRLERQPIRYSERVPQKDLSWLAYTIAAICLALLLLAKLAEVKLTENGARRRESPARRRATPHAGSHYGSAHP
ncbi:vWA domain-containing protein [Methyloligella sp. 2.7D]|uniref:vWA domain-containing protein n=1 Tax=unclassified Methyloligella TaxID=2625955 RepID=UPI00157D87C6|nr:vWA domain-containing protein [Methyloligella sp. GL2]QKP78067.1 VWA domain-containing protein [Methyloligella sp. GL2]